MHVIVRSNSPQLCIYVYVKRKYRWHAYTSVGCMVAWFVGAGGCGGGVVVVVCLHRAINYSIWFALCTYLVSFFDCMLKTYICQLEFLTVIHVGYSDFTLRHVIVIVNVIGQVAHICTVVERRNVFDFVFRLFKLYTTIKRIALQWAEV